MKIVTTTTVFTNDIRLEDAVRRLAAIGFEGIDIEMSQAPLHRDDYIEWAKSLRALADELGIIIHHAHAQSYDAADHSEGIRRALEICPILGVEMIVVHPINLTDDTEALEDPDEFFEKNVRAHAQLLAWADEFGVTLLTENLPWAVTKRPVMVEELLRRLDHPRMGWCFDTGHAALVSLDAEELYSARAPLSLHIHDAFKGIWKDEHALPGDCNVDFDAYFDALTRVGYAGDFVLEACYRPAVAPDEERDAILADLLARARLMRDAWVQRRAR